MQRIHRIFLTAVLFLVTVPVASLLAFRIPVTPVAVMEQIAPEAAMPGEDVMVTGYGLDASNVRQVYLCIYGKTEHRKVGILEQTSTMLPLSGYRRMLRLDQCGYWRKRCLRGARGIDGAAARSSWSWKGNMSERRHTPAR